MIKKILTYGSKLLQTPVRRDNLSISCLLIIHVLLLFPLVLVVGVHHLSKQEGYLEQHFKCEPFFDSIQFRNEGIR